MTKWVSTLIGINIVVFVLQFTRPELTNVLSLIPSQVATHPWTPITYMFAHGGPAHIFFNMFVLYLFGPRLEGLLGGRRFLTLYFLSGLGGALASFLPAYYDTQILGASGAILGVEAAYARVWPRDRIYIWGVVPVQIWVLVAATGLYSVVGGMGIVGQGTAHFAHLGGLFVGYFYMGWLARNSGAKKFKRSATVVIESGTDGDALRRWNAIQVASLHELNQGEVLRLLEKVRTQGARSLTLDERATLDRFSPT